MDALLDRLRVVRTFDISRVMSALVAYIDGVTEGVGATTSLQTSFSKSTRGMQRFSHVRAMRQILGGS